MPFYENVFIARQDLTPAKVSELTDKYASVIENNGGKVSKRENWGLRTLAYKIQKNRKGYYMLMNIDAPAAAVVEMERLMRLDENLLRYLTVKVDALEEGPSVMMEPKSRKAKTEDKYDVEIAEGDM
ncbi:MAG: 30S ribosomal protein S6 [Alphaproteobacteria bacterium]|nr:30S ribosomal protein S6 [Alphaproteobacteria bacterium]MBQ6854456.1 30S ribosomal protein S6 [Alphaproteobacteria bacterium]MBR4931893.1 30S ribosomal protein S6 [Alphaproteobacteria bacterium]